MFTLLQQFALFLTILVNVKSEWMMTSEKFQRINYCEDIYNTEAKKSVNDACKKIDKQYTGACGNAWVSFTITDGNTFAEDDQWVNIGLCSTKEGIKRCVTRDQFSGEGILVWHYTSSSATCTPDNIPKKKKGWFGL